MTASRTTLPLSVRIVLAASLVWLGGAAPSHAADITVLTAGAFKPILTALQPGFEHATGDRLGVGVGTAGELTKQIAGGAPFDVLIAPQEMLRAIAAEIQPTSTVGIARVGVGVVVRQGMPIPDVSTVAALRQTLLAAPSVALIDPDGGGSSGPVVMALFARLGITEELKARLVLKKGGGAVADLVADGQAALGLHQISEILPVPGVVLAGPLPQDLQTYTTYAVTIGAHPTDPAAARALVETLQSPAAMSALRARGMEPVPPP